MAMSVNPVGEPDLKRHASAEAVERGRLRRLQILEAATELFARSGYRGTGLAGIAAQVGVSQAALLHHFGSKEKLLEATIAHRAAQDAPLIAEIVGDGGLDMLDRLPLLAERQAARAGLAELFSVLVAENLHEDDPAHEFFVERYRNLRDSIVKALKVAQKRGEARKGVNLELVAVRLIAALDGIQTQWLLDRDRIDLAAAYRSLGAALRRELEA